jgi:hypothetical protein
MIPPLIMEPKAKKAMNGRVLMPLAIAVWLWTD